jgi:hypothetical protein
MKKLLLFIPLLFIASNCYGATIFEDDFNSYTDGWLNSQGNWVTNYNGSAIEVQGTTIFEGDKGLLNNHNADEQIGKSGEEIAEGKTSFYIRIDSSHDRDSYVMFFEHTSIKGAIGFQNGTLGYRGDSTWQAILADVQLENWYLIECEYSLTESGKMRFRVDGGSWTSWTTDYGAFTSHLTRIDIYSDGRTGNVFYLDYIAEEPFAAEPPGPEPFVPTAVDYGLYCNIFLACIFIIKLFDLIRHLTTSHKY